MKEYLVPTGDGEAQFIERRSRFIGHIFLTETEEEALARLKQMREQYWDATHNVYAYIIRDGATRFSDDGEPGGTAGMPVLQVLQREELYNVTCVVTRYFGGILLGAGGLVRAYAHGAKIAVDAAGRSIKRVWTNVYLPCPYSWYERIRLEVEKMIGKSVALNIVEVKNMDTNAQLVAENIAQQLENRVSFRRAMKSCMGRTMKSGAMGIKTCCSGRLGGADIARAEFYSEGTIPLQTLRADIDYGFAEANTTYGKVGVKVWIYKGEILPTKGNQMEGSDK